jgi:putative transcriptional regulator
MAKRHRSGVMESVHEAATALYQVGGLDKKTMRKFDVLCLTPITEMTAKKIRALRTARRPVKRFLQLTLMLRQAR